MRTYDIPRTDLTVSRIAYGCMQLGEIDTETAIRVVGTAVEQGVTLFDHADIYARGNSEAVFGEVLRRSPDLRDRIVLQSKCGIRFADDPSPGLPGRYDFSYDHLTGSVDGILRRLGVERLDLLLLHRPDPLGRPEEVARAFDALHAGGKVRHFGVSNHTAGQIELLQRAVDQPLVVNQVELSLLHAHLIDAGIRANIAGGPYAAAGGLLDYCRAHGILVQAWGPVAGGRLFAPPVGAEPRVHAVAAQIAGLAEDMQTTPEAVALAWLLRHPAGIQPIIGTTRPERVAASCAADGIELGRETWYALFTAARGEAVP